MQEDPQPLRPSVGRPDDTGWWTAYVIAVTDRDDTDLAIQYIDPTYVQYAMKPYVEAVFLGGAPFRNAVVVTVGKSRASARSTSMRPCGRIPRSSSRRSTAAWPGSTCP